MTRLMLFPAVPRESATSIAAMVAQTTASKEAKEISRVGNRRGLLLYSTLPCRVQQFCGITENAYGEPMDVLAKHTLLVYGTCGMSQEMAATATRNIAFGVAFRTMFPKLRPGVESGNRFGLQCPECALALAGGRSRRASLCAHCIPYVTRCPWHGCRLVCDQECSTLEMLMSKTGDFARASNSLRYAQLACVASEIMPCERIWPKTFSILREKGYVTQYGNLRTKRLHTDLRKLFSSGFEDERLSHLVTDTAAVDLCIRAAQRTDRAAPAPVLVLMYHMACDVDPIVRRPPPRAAESAKSEVDNERRDSSRAQWTAHMSRHPEMTRTELRNSMPALWHWLHRHDDAWLRANQFAARRAGGPRSRQELPIFVTRAISDSTVDRRARSGGREPLPSAYQFRLAYGMGDYLFERVTANSAAVGKAAQLPGSKEVFIHHRVTRALKELTRLAKPLDIATVARAARLRITTVRAIICNNDFEFHARDRTTSTRSRPVHCQGRTVPTVSPTTQGSCQSQPVNQQNVDASEPNGASDKPAGTKRRNS
ncbi:Tn7-like transposition protein D [Paraburkholderia sp. BL6665CI2N2]|nr:Tn7-like transposition protein D [Paraburkholderia sp. BL6665CI2N2]